MPLIPISGTYTSAQLSNLTSLAAINTNIPFNSVVQMMSFILNSNPLSLNASSVFDTWETTIATLNTTTNGTFSINTTFLDPNGQQSYVAFKNIRPFVSQFWGANQGYVTDLQLKFQLPKTYSSANGSLNQGSIDPTGAYQSFNVAFYYGGGITVAVPTAVAAVTSPPPQPVQTWYQTINNLVLNWLQQYNQQS